jgi:site-specific recombinase XerD
MVTRTRTYIKACFEYALDEDLVIKKPARKLEIPTIRKKVCERFLSLEEIGALLSEAEPREHLVLHILAACGLRPAEVLVLRIEDFDGTKLRIDEALKCAAVGNRSTLPISSIITMLRMSPTHGRVFSKSASTLTFMITCSRSSVDSI